MEVAISPQIVLAHLKRRTTLCHRRAMTIMVLDQNSEDDRRAPQFLQQFKDAAEDFWLAAQTEYEFETLMMLAECCADPGEREAYKGTLTTAAGGVFKALLDGETFAHLGIHAGRAR